MRSLNLVLLTLVAASSLAAQAYNYPALQTPRIVDREYNFAAASAGNAGTSLLFQWREELNEDWQFSLDGGIASPKSGTARVLVAGGLAWQWVRSSAEMPFDVVATGGAGLSKGSDMVVRIPVGAVVGHTFKLENGNELTAFVHPRLALDFCAFATDQLNAIQPINPPPLCVRGSKVDVDVDVGVNYEITPQVALRISGLLGGTSYVGSTNAIGFSVAWTPKGLKKF